MEAARLKGRKARVMIKQITDGERFVARWRDDIIDFPDERMAREIDRLIRRRQGEAWDEGWHYGINRLRQEDNPYRARKR